jgi:class 3 adenylate cyclase
LPIFFSIAIDIACSVFVFVYFMTFAYSAHNRNALLLSSQTELRERNDSLEIEKLRSDRLLLNLVPARLALEMSKTGGIKPAEFDPVTLVAIELRHFSRRLRDSDAQEVLAHLMHCFKAFDAIGNRLGMEKLKTMGDIYIAVAGLPTPNAGDAAAGVQAAIGIREFLADLAESRRAHGKFVLDARISVHSGKVIGGIVDTSKISYDVWGSAMKTLLQLLRACPDGQIAISESTRRLAGDTFEWYEAGTLDEGSGHSLRFHGIGKRTLEIPARV